MAVDLHKLRNFAAVAQYGSYQRASEQLHLSQSALTRSIQSLERQYGVVLFDRGRAGVTLTAVGSQLLQHATNLLYNAGTLEQVLEGAAAGRAGDVYFGIEPLAATLELPRILGQLTRNHPGLYVHVTTGTMDMMMTQLFEGKLEFVLGLGLPTYPVERLQTEWLGYAGPEFLVRRGHPLTTLSKVPASRLSDFPKASGSAWNDALSYLPLDDLREQLRACIECDNYDLLIRTVMATDAILVSSYGMDIKELDKLIVEVDDQSGFGQEDSPDYLSRVGIFSLAARSLSPAALTLIDQLRNLNTSLRGVRPD